MFNDQLRHADVELELARASLALVHLLTDSLGRQVGTCTGAQVDHRY